MEGSNVNNSEVIVTGHDEMLKVDKKHLFWQRLSAFAMMAMFGLDIMTRQGVTVLKNGILTMTVVLLDIILGLNKVYSS